MKLRNLLLLALLPGATMCAQVTLPTILTSHMVVQRDLPVHVWGRSAPGEEVTVSFRGETRTAKAGELGRWSVYLKPGAAGGPFEMKVEGAAGAAQAITLDDVLVGDVWVASGQSNMEFRMHQAATAAQDLPHAANPRIRLLMVKQIAAEYPQDEASTDGTAAAADAIPASEPARPTASAAAGSPFQFPDLSNISSFQKPCLQTSCNL